MKKNLYKIIILELESFEAYIFANNPEEAHEKAIYTDINTRSNQDFEQRIVYTQLLKESEYPIGTTLNE